MANLIFKTAAAIALTCSPLAVGAACFDKSDMGRGLVVAFSNDNTVIMRRNNAGMIEITETYGPDSGPDTLFTGAYGLYFTEEVDTLNGTRQEDTRLNVNFTNGIPPVPTLGLSWEGPTVNIFADGWERDEIYSVNINSTRNYELSGCTYETLVVRVRYEWPDEDDGFGLEYVYFPTLESAVLISSAVDDKSIPPNVPISITPAAK